MYIPSLPHPSEMEQCSINYHVNKTKTIYLYNVNFDLQVIIGSISILIGLLVIPYIRKIKSYLPSLIVACNMLFGVTALEEGLVGSIALKTDKVSNQTIDLNIITAAYFF
jgi:hypothetical protein